MILDLNKPSYETPYKTSIYKIQLFYSVRPKRYDKGTGKRGMVEGTNATSCKGKGTYLYVASCLKPGESLP